MYNSMGMQVFDGEHELVKHGPSVGYAKHPPIVQIVIYTPVWYVLHYCTNVKSPPVNIGSHGNLLLAPAWHTDL